MTVYIDTARHSLGRMLMSHMTADTMEELNEMAQLVGLKRVWLQVQGLPHYDLCQKKRELAIHYGAKVVSSKEIVRVARRLKSGAERRADRAEATASTETTASLESQEKGCVETKDGSVK